MFLRDIVSIHNQRIGSSSCSISRPVCPTRKRIVGRCCRMRRNGSFVQPHSLHCNISGILKVDTPHTQQFITFAEPYETIYDYGSSYEAFGRSPRSPVCTLLPQSCLTLSTKSMFDLVEFVSHYLHFFSLLQSSAHLLLLEESPRSNLPASTGTISSSPLQPSFLHRPRMKG